MMYLTAVHDPDQPTRWDWMLTRDYLKIGTGEVIVPADDPAAVLVAVAEQMLARRGLRLEYRIVDEHMLGKETE